VAIAGAFNVTVLFVEFILVMYAPVLIVVVPPSIFTNSSPICSLLVSFPVVNTSDASVESAVIVNELLVMYRSSLYST